MAKKALPCSICALGQRLDKAQGCVLAHCHCWPSWPWSRRHTHEEPQKGPVSHDLLSHCIHSLPKVLFGSASSAESLWAQRPVLCILLPSSGQGWEWAPSPCRAIPVPQGLRQPLPHLPAPFWRLFALLPFSTHTLLCCWMFLYLFCSKFSAGQQACKFLSAAIPACLLLS